MHKIDISTLKDEGNDLEAFLKSKLDVEVKSDGKVMSVGSEGDKVPRGKVTDCVERFFHRKGLTENYSVRNEKDVIKIVKKK